MGHAKAAPGQVLKGRCVKGQKMTKDNRPLGELLHQLRAKVGALVRQEVTLAKTEAGGKLALARRDAGLIGAGAAVA
jgi:hypothetical protein